MFVVVLCDGFFDQSTITDRFKLPNAKFIADSWHLFEVVFEKWFGKAVYGLLQRYLYKTSNALNEQQYLRSYDKAMSIV